MARSIGGFEMWWASRFQLKAVYLASSGVYL